MSTGDVDAVTKQLAQTSVDNENVLSFAKEGLKLDSADDAKKIIDALNTRKCVKTLTLDGNTMGVAAAKAIGQALEKHSEFQNALWSDMFTGRLKSEIPEALQYLGEGVVSAGAHLRELDLSDNAFGPNGMKGLVDLLHSNSCFSLEILRLHNNGLGTTGGKMLADCLLECHKRSMAAGRPLALKVFQSGRGRLENVGSIALAEAFKAMGSLEEVIMPQNGIYHEGITALAEAFTANKNLRHICLQDNTFTHKGAQSMAGCLKQLENLENIHFGDCLLRTEGALILAKALKGSRSKLKILNLTFNEINKKGAVAITEAMEAKDSLESLQLDGNCLGSEGTAFVKSIMENAGRIDMLGSLSEDEGTDEEEDDEDDLEEVTDEEAEDNLEGEEVDDPHLCVQGVSVTPRSDKVVTVADFLQFPSPTKLELLGSQRGRALVDHLGNSIDDVDVCIQTVMRTCAVVTPESKKTKQEACECADAVLSRAFSSDDEGRVGMITNAILVHLGLIKGEDKKFRPITNLKGALLVLHHTVQQKYFPKVSKDILACFLSRPSDQFDNCMDVKHQLLSVLMK